MNSALVRWLLDLDRIPAGADGLKLVWERPWPGWFWAMALVGAGLYAVWSYSRLAGHRNGRGTLAMVRLVVLFLLLVLVSGPMLELRRIAVEEDWVILLVDRSESMTIADAGDADNRVSRDDQLARLLDDNRAVFEGLDADRHLLWLGFNSGVFDLASMDSSDQTPEPNSSPVDLGPADGRRTNLNTALGQALQRVAARPVSGVVVFSDGRTPDPPTRAVFRRLQAEGIKVFTVPLGSNEPLGDLAVRRVDAPRRAFVRDKVPVTVELDRFGEAVGEMIAVVRLIDDQTGRELDRVELDGDESVDRITLTAEPRLAGHAVWRVEIEADRTDLIPDNNVKLISIELIDRPLRVLYIDGYPRWDYRFLKWLLIREESIESSIILISADRDFAQEGNLPLARLPRSPEEFAQFDLIILGDVAASFFPASLLDMIRDHVAERGAGLLWIGGERSMPSSYAGTALADLLPVGGSLALQPIGTPVNMMPTRLAERLGVLQMVSSNGESGWPRELTDPSFGWSRLFWAQRIDPAQMKPTAEALATTMNTFDGQQLPLVIRMRYGAGQTIYVATDEIWRWRYGRGELLPEQFWIQIVRMLGRASLAGADDAAVLSVEPRRLAIGQPMQIDLRLLEAQLAGMRLAKVRAVLETTEGEPIAELELRPAGDLQGQFASTYLPGQTGRLRVRITDDALHDLQLQADVEVFSPDDEMRRPETDHSLLATLATQTDGEVVDPAEFDRVPALLPNRSVRTNNPLTERIWDSPLAFLLVLLALTGEWVGRKLLRLA